MCACKQSVADMLPHWNAMLQKQNMTPNPVTVYRYGADLSMCYQMMWNITFEAPTSFLMS